MGKGPGERDHEASSVSIGGRPDGAGTDRDYGVSEEAAVLRAVRDDIRQTLRSGWVDPGIEAATTSPVFFTAAWSAIRPNAGRTFLALAKVIRGDAAQAIQEAMPPRDWRPELQAELSDEEMRRTQEAAKAGHLVTAKSAIVVHTMLRAVRRQRIAGTGKEEAAVRRGIPDWQRWMSAQPSADGAHEILEEATVLLGSPDPPTPLRLFARWPSVLSTLWRELKPKVRTEAWNDAAVRLRRRVLWGMTLLPHPVELQWTALHERGLTERDRLELAAILAQHEAVMADQSLMAAFAWLGFGAPEIGVEG